MKLFYIFAIVILGLGGYISNEIQRDQNDKLEFELRALTSKVNATQFELNMYKLNAQAQSEKIAHAEQEVKILRSQAINQQFYSQRDREYLESRWTRNFKNASRQAINALDSKDVIMARSLAMVAFSSVQAGECYTGQAVPAYAIPEGYDIMRLSPLVSPYYRLEKDDNSLRIYGNEMWGC